MGFVTDYSGFTLTFHLVLLTLYLGFTHMLHWYYSRFSLTFTHRLLQVLSLFTSSLLTVFCRFLLTLHSGFFSHCTNVLLTLYSRFALSSLRVYSHCTTLLSGYTHPSVQDLSHLNPCLPMLNCKSPHSLLPVYTHFTTCSHTLHRVCSYISLGFTHTLVWVYSHLALGLCTLYQALLILF